MHCFSSSIRFQTLDQVHFCPRRPLWCLQKIRRSTLVPSETRPWRSDKALGPFLPSETARPRRCQSERYQTKHSPHSPRQTWRSDKALGSLGKLTFPLLALRHLHPVISPSALLSPLALLSSLSPLSSIALLSSLSSNYHMLSSLWIIILIKLLSSLLFLSNYHHNYHSYQVINIIIILTKLSS